MTNAEKRILKRYTAECHFEAVNAETDRIRVRWGAWHNAMQELNSRLLNAEAERSRLAFAKKRDAGNK